MCPLKERYEEQERQFAFQISFRDTALKEQCLRAYEVLQAHQIFTQGGEVINGLQSTNRYWYLINVPLFKI
jgi:hypothetical protein